MELVNSVVTLTMTDVGNTVIEVGGAVTNFDVTETDFVELTEDGVMLTEDGVTASEALMLVWFNVEFKAMFDLSKRRSKAHCNDET